MSARQQDQVAGAEWERLAARFAALPAERRAAFLAALEARGISFDRLPIVAFADQGPDCLALNQRRLWFLWQLDPESHAYNMGGALELEGPLDEPALDRALSWLVARHDTLRMTFEPLDNGEAQPVVHPPASLAFARDDVTSGDPEGAMATARRLAEERVKAPFDLVAGPLLRAGLVRVAPERHLLWLVTHHIVSDGWSMDVLIEELLEAYASFKAGEAPGLPAPPIRYADYAAWQRVRMEAGELERQLAWWTQELGSEHAPLNLPTDRPRPATQSFRGGKLAFALDEDTSRRVRALAQSEGATLFMLLLSGLHALLARLTGEDDIRIGVSSANRIRPETERLPGFFVTTQVIRARLGMQTSFRDLLQAVKEKALAAQARPDVPFETLVEALQPERSLSYNPLFQVKFTQQLAPRVLQAGDLVARPAELAESATHFDLSLDVIDGDRCIEASLTFAADLFDLASAERIAGQYADLIGFAVRHPTLPLGDWQPARRAELSGGSLPLEHADLLSAFAAQVRARPEATAVQAGHSTLTYKELDDAAGRLARVLQSHGVGPERVVATLCGRSTQLVVALLAIWRAGGVYAPLDPSQPAERLRRLAVDSGALLVLCDGEGRGAADTLDLPVLAIAGTLADRVPAADGPLVSPLPDQAAYLIYTSGSTGEPKGVLVPHRAITSYVQSMLARLDLAPEAGFGMVSTPAADLGHTMSLGALASGRCLHLIEADAAFDADRLADIVQSQRIGVLKLVPGHLEGLLSTPRAAELLPATAVILGGEALSSGLVAKIRALKPGCRVINHYGPTETAVGVLAHEPADLPAAGGVPVGRPFAYVEAVILDADLNPTLPGALGELYIGGNQVARGYLGRPGATAIRFVPDPRRPGQRLYRTGDVVRLDAEDRIHFLGRRDDQVKIRGYRVELREVALALRALDGVDSAQVVVETSEAGRDRLVAYIVAPEAVATKAASDLAKTLPAHMVPSEVIALARMPLTANGKLDRKALPKKAATNTPSASAPTGTSALQAVLSVAADVLRRAEVRPEDNFFALGGDSILSLQLIARTKRQGFRLKPKQVFECPTFKALADAAEPLAPPAAPAKPAAPSALDAVLAVAAEVLRRPAVQAEDNFFALGGDSILSLQLIARTKRQGFRLKPKQVFECPTFKALADAAKPLAAPTAAPAKPAAPSALDTVLAVAAEVLRRPKVQAEDNFFALGGDSILSLQLIARTKRQGFRLKPKQVFECATFKALADAAEPLAAPTTAPAKPVSAARPAVGVEVPMTPIQAAFFARPVPDRNHWCQSILLASPGPIDAQALGRALGGLVRRHEALRATYAERNGRWVQRILKEADTVGLVWERNYATAETLTALCEEVQKSLDIAQGPLLRALVASGSDGTHRLLLVIHHLAVDGVSWRVLLDDLALAFTQVGQGQPIDLPAPETGFSSFAQQLFLHAHSEELREELAIWARDDQPADLPTQVRLKDAVQVSQTFEPGLVERLATAGHEARLHEMMIAALARALASGQDEIALWLEGHGRETPFDLDLSRTVGWLTSIYPARIRLGADLRATLDGVRQSLIAIPNGGLGYGLLRYLATPDLRAAVATRPGPIFNFLGHLDSTITALGGFTLAPESAGAERDPEAPMLDPMRIDARVVDGSLRVDWLFDPILYDKAAISGLTDAFAAGLRELAGDTQPSGTVVEASSSYGLSPMQQGLLFRSLMAPGDAAYVNLLAVTFDDLDVQRFKRAWELAFARHDILRTTFQWQDGAEPRQIVHVTSRPEFIEHDWRGAAGLEEKLRRLGHAERQRGFDLTAAPPMRLVLVRIAEKSWRFLWVRHHILLDGWSSARLLAELAATYRGQPTAARGPRFKAYIDWLAARDAAGDAEFWRAALKDVDEPFRLGGQGKGPVGHARRCLTLDAARTTAIRKAAAEARVTLNTLFQAAFALVLSRRAGKPALFGVTVAGRPDDLLDIEETLGLFINTLPVLSDPRPDLPVQDYLRQLQAQNVALRDHQQTPLFDIQAWVGAGREELFDSVVIFENYPVDAALSTPAAGALAFREPLVDEDTHYTLTLMVETGVSTNLTFGYATERLSSEDVEALARQFELVLESIVARPDLPLGRIRLASDVEAAGAAGKPMPVLQAVQDAFRSQAAANPDRLAVRAVDGELSYAELDRQADAVAARLQILGVGRGCRVGLFVARGVHMLVGMLGVLKAGAAYVPLDPDYPADRVAYMASDAGLKALVTTADLRVAAPSGDWPLVDLAEAAFGDVAPRPFEAEVQDIAYVIYTSGSTGRPKGVMVGHGALANLLASFEAAIAFEPADRLVAVTSLSFDIAALELLLPLTCGATLTLASREQVADPRQLASLLQEAQATVLQATPSGWRQLMAIDWQGINGLTALCGGEALPPDLASWLLPRVGALWNVYGPTETTIWSTAGRIDAVDGPPPIGAPIGATSLHILDDALQPVAAGNAGELCIGGAGLARGYLARPDLTAERFIPDPFGPPGGRLYRTGDLARLRADGGIDILARIDQQVKIRGHRIETGEIEAALLTHPAVTLAAVTAKDGTDLFAYVVLASELGDEALKAHLSTLLPAYMMPSAFVRLERMPLTPNGKLNRAALPAPTRIGAAYAPPAGDTEAAIAAIWADLLQAPRVGRADDFFRLGGHSLTATRMVARLEIELGVKVPLRALFDAPLLQDFALAVDTARGGEDKLASLDALLAELDA